MRVKRRGSWWWRMMNWSRTGVRVRRRSTPRRVYPEVGGGAGRGEGRYPWRASAGWEEDVSASYSSFFREDRFVRQAMLWFSLLRQVGWRALVVVVVQVQEFKESICKTLGSMQAEFRELRWTSPAQALCLRDSTICLRARNSSSCLSATEMVQGGGSSRSTG